MMELMSILDNQTLIMSNLMKNYAKQHQFRSNTWETMHVQKENHVILEKVTVTEILTANLVSNVVREIASSNFQDYLDLRNMKGRMNGKMGLIKMATATIATILISTKKLPNATQIGLIQLQFKLITRVIVLAQKENHVISVRVIVIEILTASMVSNVGKGTNSRSFQDLLVSKSLKERTESTAMETVTTVTILNMKQKKKLLMLLYC